MAVKYILHFFKIGHILKNIIVFTVRLIGTEGKFKIHFDLVFPMIQFFYIIVVHFFFFLVKFKGYFFILSVVLPHSTPSRLPISFSRANRNLLSDLKFLAIFLLFILFYGWHRSQGNLIIWVVQLFLFMACQLVKDSVWKKFIFLPDNFDFYL